MRNSERWARLADVSYLDGEEWMKTEPTSWNNKETPEKEEHFLKDISIFQGGMGVGVSLGGLAGAVAAQGGAGTISTAQIGFREPDFTENPLKANLRAIGKELRRARILAGSRNGEPAEGKKDYRGLIGVNIMTVTQNYGAYVKEAIKEGADFIVSGAGLPMELPSLARGSRVKLIPVVSSLKAAAVICKRWLKKDGILPDAVLIEGPLAGGHLGFDAETARKAAEIAQESGRVLMSDGAEKKQQRHCREWFEAEVKQIVTYLRQLGEQEGKYIPVITAGGFQNHRDLLHQRALGADRIQVATRFVVTEECDAHPAFKQAYVNCKKEDIAIIKSPVGMPGRAIRNAFVQKTEKMRIAPEKCCRCISVCKPSETPYCITQALIRSVTGDVENGLIFCGANAWMEERITTVKEVMASFLSGTCTGNF